MMMMIMRTMMSTVIPFNYATAAVVMSVLWLPTRQLLRRMTGRTKSNQRIARGGRLFVEELEEMDTANVNVSASNGIVNGIGNDNDNGIGNDYGNGNGETLRELCWNVFWAAFQMILAGLAGMLAAVWNATNARTALPIIAKGKLRQSVRFQQHSDGSVLTRRLYYDPNAAPDEPVVEEDVSTPGSPARRTIPVPTTPLRPPQLRMPPSPAMPFNNETATPTTPIPHSAAATVDATPPPHKDLLRPPKSPSVPPMAAFASVKNRVATPMKKRARRIEDDHYQDISVQPPPAIVPFSEHSTMIPMIPLSIQYARKRGRTTTSTQERPPMKRMALVSRQRAKPNKMDDNKRKEREENLVKEFSRKRPKLDPKTKTTTLNAPPIPSFAFRSTTISSAKPAATTEPAFSFSTALADATNAPDPLSEATTNKVPAFSFATALPDATPASDTDGTAAPTTTTDAPAKPLAFAFGSADASDTRVASTKPTFAFGSNPSDSEERSGKPTFAFGSTPVDDNVTGAYPSVSTEAPGAPPVFAFGAKTTDANTPSFSFGAKAPAAVSGGFSFGGTAAPGPPAFGAVPSFSVPPPAGGGGAASQRRRAAKNRRKGMA